MMGWELPKLFDRFEEVTEISMSYSAAMGAREKWARTCYLRPSVQRKEMNYS